MEITGKIIARLDKKSGTTQSGTAWVSQEYVIEEVADKYPKKMCFRVFGDEDKIVSFQKVCRKNALVKVSFDVNAREYNGRWYNDINAWKAEPVNEAATPAEPAPKSFTPEDQKKVDAIKDKFGAEEVKNDAPDDIESTDELPF